MKSILFLYFRKGWFGIVLSILIVLTGMAIPVALTTTWVYYLIPSLFVPDAVLNILTCGAVALAAEAFLNESAVEYMIPVIISLFIARRLKYLQGIEFQNKGLLLRSI